MTDDGQQNDCGGIWEAGYRAAMEEARAECIHIESTYGPSPRLEFLKRWLDEQVKKEQPREERETNP